MSDNIIDAEIIGDANAVDDPTLLTTEAAFIVYLDPQGHWVADGNIDRPVQTARAVNVSDFFHACATIQKDVTVADTTRQLIIAQQQIAQQMQQQMQEQKIAQNIAGGIDLSKLRG